MHPKNPHRKAYDFDTLCKSNPTLKNFVFVNEHQKQTINFSDPAAVFQLNRSLLLTHYGLTDYILPDGYLCPAVPGRVDYLCHMESFFKDRKLLPRGSNYRVLDIGVGANSIFPILGAQHFEWEMVGIDIHQSSVDAANAIIGLTKGLDQKIDIRHQKDNANIFKGAIYEGEYFDFTVCNPPFHKNEQEATRGTKRKLSNLSLQNKSEDTLNFGGKANELWCNGGEALFIKRMIKQSLSYKDQVRTFTTLVSNASNLKKLQKQLDKAKALHETISMKIGNKQSRVLTWRWEGNTKP